MAEAVSGFMTSLWARPPEPSYPVLPAHDEQKQTSVPGVYVVGECAGTPLLKLGMNEGAALAERLAAELKPGGDVDVHDVVVVGAGAAGLACALRLTQRGLSVLVLEAHQMAHTVVQMTRGKHIFAEPHGVSNHSDLFLEECTREDLLLRWRAQVHAAGLQVVEGSALQGLSRSGDVFTVRASGGDVRARRVVLALGKAGNPRMAGVPGEQQHVHKIATTLSDPEALRQQRVVIYGGGDVACEAALALLGVATSVTLVTVDAALTFPKKRNRDAVEAAAQQGQLSLHLGSKLQRIDAQQVAFTDASGAMHTLDNDHVLVMIGADPPVALFRKLGLALEGAWDWRRWLNMLAVFALVFTLYAGKKLPEEPASFPLSRLVDMESYTRVVGAIFRVAFAPFSLFLSQRALDDVHHTLWFQHGFLYSLGYTVVMGLFGWQALMRWSRTARSPGYQRARYATLMAFQLAFFIGVNVVGVQALSVQYSWRGWGLYQPWPLFFHTFNWWSASDSRAVLVFFVGSGLFGTFVVMPLLSWKHGKRFCSWVCGCGGMAETLGDRWRHLAPKGARSRAWEFQATVILLVATFVTLVTVLGYHTRADNPWALAYSYVVDFWLVAVVPMALYPFFGGKIWCRYWCPLAAWNQLLAHAYGRLGIHSNDKCISCGQCSKQCQVGVDVMAFAKNQQRFDNRDSSCIHCGICIDVCPVDVLSFHTESRKEGRARKAVGRSLPILP